MEGVHNSHSIKKLNTPGGEQHSDSNADHQEDPHNAYNDDRRRQQHHDEIPSRSTPPTITTTCGYYSQILVHWTLAVLIGVSLRMTTFPQAMIAVQLLGDNHYARQTSFLVAFGLTKACSNVFVGWWSDLTSTSACCAGGRRLPHAVGWLAGIVLAIILLRLVAAVDKDDSSAPKDDNNHANSILWTHFCLANIFLGMQQGMTWTTNIFMLLDIMGPNHRALASGLSNSTGYLASALATYTAAALSPLNAFRVVLVSSILGLVLSVTWMKDTSPWVQQEQKQQQSTAGTSLAWSSRHGNGDEPYHVEDVNDELQEDEHAKQSFASIFSMTSWHNPSLSLLCCSGLTTNLVTSLSWGLVLIWGKQQGLSSQALAAIGSSFTIAKAVAQLVMSHISDAVCHSRKIVLVGGFSVASAGLVLTACAGILTSSDDPSRLVLAVGEGDQEYDTVSLYQENRQNHIYIFLLVGGLVIGSGIGSVYCVMTGALSDHSRPESRASVIGVYKFWRDSGYAVGGLLTGVMADVSGGSFVITTLVVAALVAGLVLWMVVVYQDAPRQPWIAAATNINERDSDEGIVKRQEMQQLHDRSLKGSFA